MNLFVGIRRQQIAMGLQRIVKLDLRRRTVPRDRSLPPVGKIERHEEVVDAPQPSFDLLPAGSVTVTVTGFNAGPPPGLEPPAVGISHHCCICRGSVKRAPNPFRSPVAE